MGSRHQLMTQADENAGTAARGTAHQQLIHQGKNILQAGVGTIEAGGIVDRGIAALHHRGDAGTQHIGQPPGIGDTALPHRIKNGVGIGDLLQYISDVLGSPHRLTLQVDTHIGPGFDDRDALAVDLGKPQQQIQFDPGGDHLFQGRRRAPFKRVGIHQHVPPGKRRGGFPVIQKVAQQGMNGLGRGGVGAQDARPGLSRQGPAKPLRQNRAGAALVWLTTGQTGNKQVTALLIPDAVWIRPRSAFAMGSDRPP